MPKQKEDKGVLYFLSFVLMGIYHIVNGQFVKGLLFFLVEALFIFFLGTAGIQNIFSLSHLGTQQQGWVYDKDLGIELLVQGDNSMLLLIYGIVALITLVVFILFYISYTRSIKHLAERIKNQQPVPTFIADFKSLWDSRFHLTLLSVPAIGIILFTIMPLVYMISIAFTSFDHSHLPPKSLFSWVGFKNFQNILTGRMSETFLPVFAWTIVWAVFATLTCFIFGILLALFIQKKTIRWKGLYRSIFVLTIAVPQFVSLLIMRNLFHTSGPINEWLLQLGLIHSPIPFLIDPLLAKISVIVINMWIGIPVYMLISTGVIMNLPQDQIEAAHIDGANIFQVFKRITMPQLIFVMTPNLIQQFIGNINNFNVIYLLTEGGPANSNYYGAGSTDLLVTWLYKLTTEKADYNLASVIGILTFVLSATFSLIMYTRSKAFKSEGEF
ncbi:sugar ABC transporter permease [Paenibacillus sp. HN-1]|uniref:carbohydrate ABC transporter permease n=1 Tax=Paenibacillus TaxID=44249 RepID=UPI001CA8A821|nr:MULTISPECIES: sugar ABC transporter permease [Paenibacillus]MBY9080305.1 sugar ABC transporter permease [Paenibacillus sp. CGMCC 1.18879]MBY9083036.1 sugar ABC transporter permease [Paenibacillus sinensis]